jgi:GMP synthase PP-ATPase subunit
VDELLKYGGWVVALVASVFAGAATLKKTKVDESGQAIQAWKEITDRHERELVELRAELQAAQLTNDELRKKLRQVEDDCYEERKEFRREVEGLNRQNLQLHASYLAQMTILADPHNPDHVNLLKRAQELLETATRAYTRND